MAFYNWVEQINISNVLDETSFSNETSRKTGFRPNELTNADIVNSGLRQANLISVALMNSLNITNRNLQSSVEDVSNDITNKLNNSLNYISLNGTTNLQGSIIPSNNTCKLGNSNNQFNEIYGTTIYAGNTNVGTSINNINSNITDLQNYNTDTNFKWDSLTNLGADSNVSSGSATLIKKGGLVICSISFVGTSLTSGSSYNLINLYGGAYLPSSVYYNNKDEHNNNNFGGLSCSGDLHAYVYCQWVNSNYAQIKMQMTNSGAGVFSGQICWFTDN